MHIKNMSSSGRVRAVPLLLWVAGAALLATSGCAAWRIGQSADLARESEPWQQRPGGAAKRLLIVGDSTAVGTGASSAERSLAGLIGKAHPGLVIENRARDGAKFSDILSQLSVDTRFDFVLVQGGGNDIIRLTSLPELMADIGQVAERASQSADQVILMPAGNVGNAPLFFPPVSWWMTQRSRKLHTFVREAAERNNAFYINLFHETQDDPFVLDPSLNARDGLHPSDAGYAVWYQALLQQGGALLSTERVLPTHTQ